MASLGTTLTAAQLQLIADYLVSQAPPPQPATGQELYDANCGGCHGFSPNSAKAGADITRINSGIASVSAMASLGTTLTAAQLQLIADYLVSQAPSGGGSGGPIDVPHTNSQGGVLHATGNNTPYSSGCASCHGARLRGALGPSCYSCHNQEWNQSPPNTNDGNTLYDTYCAGCHGFGNDSSKIGASASRIQSGIAGVSLMSSLSVLSSTQVQAISNYLISLSPPSGGGGGTDGQALYDTNCGGCHGMSPNSTKAGADINRINAGIASVSAMSSLNQLLTSAQLQAIADYLTSLSPGGGGGGGTSDGASLYANFCASCHGVGENSTKAGATVARINAGISSVNAMSSLGNVLSAADIQAIADYLGTLSVPTTPGGLYSTYCAACHGADARGGTSGESVRGASSSSISRAISGVSVMRSLNFLSSSEIQLISQYLNSLPTSRTRFFRRGDD